MRTILSEVENDNITGIKELLKDGIDINEEDCFWGTPLHLAVHNGKLEIIEFLLIEGADVNSTNAEGETPIFMICYFDKKLFKMLLDYGADLNIKNNNGRTILDRAYEETFDDLINLLKSYGAKSTIKPEDYGLSDDNYSI